MKKTIFALAVGIALAGCSSVNKTAAPAAAEVPPPNSPLWTQNKSATPQENAVKTRQTLFVIERSLNKNVLHYDAQLTADGRLVPREPVVVYWKMLDEDGRTEDITWIEKLRAYGFAVEQTAGGNAYKMTLAAAPGRPFLIKSDGQNAHAEGLIGGRPAVIERIYVNTSSGVLGPKVENIELHGTNIQTGKPAKEVIVP